MSLWIRPRPGRACLAGAPMLVAHRGGAGLAPENTLAAFREADRTWEADMVELDVRRTRDGHLVVIHDETVDRTTDGTGRVRDHTLDELRELDAGHRFRDAAGGHPFRGRGVTVPTLDEVLEACPSMRITIEIKEVGVARPLVATLARHGAEHRVVVAAEREEWRRGARVPRAAWGAARGQIRRFWLAHRLPGGGPYTPGADVFQVPEVWERRRVVSPAFVREAHRRNIAVQIWTVDDADDMRRLLSWGVDGIQTDRPDVLAAVLSEVADRPPPPGSRSAEAP